MARYATKSRVGFIWLPREMTTKWDIKIDSISVRNSVLSAEFSKGIIPDIGTFKLVLDNNASDYNNYVGKETVDLYVDFIAGTTKRFTGYIDGIKKRFVADKGWVVELIGSHLTADIVDITVTEQYEATTTCSEILKVLITNYLTGYTYANVESSTINPTIKWNNKPFVSCVKDLCDLAGFNCYVDDDKDFHFFESGSKKNNDEAIVCNDTMLEIQGLGEHIIDVKNKIIVYGDDGSGLPIINTTEDSDSQSDYGIREKIISDSIISTIKQAVDYGNAQISLLSNPDIKGSAKAYLLPSLNPGDMIWIADPTNGIHNQYKIASFTQKLPSEETYCNIEVKRDLPEIFRERMSKELALETVTNPNKMKYSLNFKFNDYTELSYYGLNIAISDGFLKLTSGLTDYALSNLEIVNNDVTSAELRIVGDNVTSTNAVVALSTNGGTNFTNLILNTPVVVPTGKELMVKFTLNSTSTQLDSVGIYYK